MTEFRTIARFPNYKVSNEGQIMNKYGRILSLNTNQAGYKRIGIYNVDTGKIVTSVTHRLVAEAFLTTWDPKLQVNHINSVKDDNRVENLEMMTESQNKLHALANGVNKSRIPEEKKDAIRALHLKGFTFTYICKQFPEISARSVELTIKPRPSTAKKKK